MNGDHFCRWIFRKSETHPLTMTEWYKCYGCETWKEVTHFSMMPAADPVERLVDSDCLCSYDCPPGFCTEIDVERGE